MKIVDRKTNTLIEKEANKAVRFLYNNVVGRVILKPLTLPLCTKASAIYMNSKFSKILIKEDKKKYTSYNNYFTRYYEQKVDQDKDHFISPCDAKLTVYKLTKNSTFKIKDSIYEVKDLILKDISSYHNGYVLIFRLETTDYHRYCYIDSGTKEKNTYIKGIFHTVQPISDKYKIYKRNAREYTILHTDNLGDVIQIEVGALMVGKIKNLHQEYKFYKGEEKGYFEYGGSTIVLIVKKDIIKIDDDILENSSKDIETIVSYGEKIGKRI